MKEKIIQATKKAITDVLIGTKENIKMNQLESNKTAMDKNMQQTKMKLIILMNKKGWKLLKKVKAKINVWNRVHIESYNRRVWEIWDQR